MPRISGVPDDISLQTGPMLLGNLFGYGLFGILTVQIFIYYHAFPQDNRYMKIIVWLTYFIDTLITVFATIAAWNVLAAGWGNTATLTPLDWPFTGLPFLSALVASMIHFFFAWRILKLRRSYIIPAIICLISLVSLGMATFCGIHGRSLGLAHLSKLKPFVIIWLGGSTLVDVAITLVMVMILFRAKNTTVFANTTSGISKLITVTVETGMTTAAGALVELVLFVAYPTNNLHFLVFLMLAKLYSNTLLATLNSRSTLNQDNRVAKPALWNDESTRSGQSAGSVTVSTQFRSRGPPPTGVQISTITERRDDMEMYIIDKDAPYRGMSVKGPTLV